MTNPELPPQQDDVFFYQTLAEDAASLAALADSEKEFVPTTEDIRLLKDTVNSRPYIGDEICGYIAAALYVPGLSEDHVKTKKAERGEISFASSTPKTIFGIMRAIGAIASEWRIDLEKGVRSPDDEWHKSREDAAIFIQALRRISNSEQAI